MAAADEPSQDDFDQTVTDEDRAAILLADHADDDEFIDFDEFAARIREKFHIRRKSINGSS